MHSAGVPWISFLAFVAPKECGFSHGSEHNHDQTSRKGQNVKCKMVPLASHENGFSAEAESSRRCNCALYTSSCDAE
jgi:hypothetical protein